MSPPRHAALVVATESAAVLAALVAIDRRAPALERAPPGYTHPGACQ